MTKTILYRKIWPILTVFLLSTTLAVSWAVGYRAGKKVTASAVLKPASPDDMDGWHPSAGDGWAELSKVLRSMQQQCPVYGSGQIRLINNENGKLIEAQPFVLECADSSRSRYQVASQEMITDRDLFVAIDHDSKLILVEKASGKASQGSPMEQIKQLFARQKDTLQLMVNDRGDHMLYCPGFTSNGLSMLKLYYNTSDYMIRKMVMYQVSVGERQDSTASPAADTSLAEPANGATPYYANRLEFVYDKIRKGDSPDLHYYDPYIRVSGRNVALTAAAKDYRLINTLSHQPSK
jgi:hypothetical protein